jgi:hypothetical protein
MYSGIDIGERPKGHLDIMGNTQQPWFHIDAVSFLFSKLDKSHSGFEFGSGSSTFWFSKFTNKIISVESCNEWYDLIEKKIKETQVKNINYIYSSCEMLEIWEYDKERGGDYEKYAGTILDFKNNFDYISVDGVARSMCICNSINKLNPGGYLIIDNSERPAYWEAISTIPENWERFIFKNQVDQTSIYRKPIV